MTVNSRQKGKRYELELVHELKRYGFNVHRGQQYCGANGDADVVGLPGVHIEAKHCEQMRLWDWVAQAVKDARKGELPAVFHRKNNEKTLVTMQLKDWITLYTIAYMGDSERQGVIKRYDDIKERESIWKEKP